MAHAGQTISNPVSGERITFRETADDTNGELLAFTLELDADGQVPGMHVHPSQEERFEIVHGTMKFRKGLRTVTAEAGDVVVVEPGTAHKFSNGGEEKAIVNVEVRPALRMEELFETAMDLANEGRTTRKGMPKPLDLALFVREFSAEVQGPFPPAWMQRAALAPVAWVARKRGLAKRYQPKPAYA